MKKLCIIPIVLLACFLACFSEAAPAINVKVQKAQEGTVDSTKEYIGTVEPIQRVTVKPELSTRISRVHFSEGSFVKAGAALFTLDNAQYTANTALRKAQLARADAALDRAQKYMKRLKASDKRSVSAADLDTADNDIKSDNGNILLPGAMVRITLKPEHEQKGVLVPQAAIMSDINGSYVYVIEGDTAKLRRVKSLSTSGENMVVSGVNPGDVVAEYGVQFLTDGAKVNIQDK